MIYIDVFHNRYKKGIKSISNFKGITTFYIINVYFWNIIGSIIPVPNVFDYIPGTMCYIG
jgi:hypothetical protein